MPAISGLDVLSAAKASDPDCPVILMTAQASLQSAISAVNDGAFHYVQKPFQNDALVAIVRRAAETRQLKTENKALKREIKKVKGVGDYAAENLLKLIGRYEGLALDSWLRAQFARKRNKGRATDDKKIERYYSKFGEWRGLALWCDKTRDWMEDGSLMS